jgi:type I restriction enzyme S subunit
MEECPFAIPHSWCWTIFSSVCELITGSTPSKAHSEYYGGEFPFYKPSDLDAGRHVTVPSEYLSDKGKEVSRIIPEKSTAICCIGSIGKCGYIEREGTTNQQINTAVPMRCLYSLYLYYYCNSKSFVDTLTEGSSAITISIVNKSKLGKMPISLPPLAEQKRIVAKIEELFAALDGIKESLDN